MKLKKKPKTKSFCSFRKHRLFQALTFSEENYQNWKKLNSIIEIESEMFNEIIRFYLISIDFFCSINDEEKQIEWENLKWIFNQFCYAQCFLIFRWQNSLNQFSVHHTQTTGKDDLHLNQSFSSRSTQLSSLNQRFRQSRDIENPHVCSFTVTKKQKKNEF